MNKYQIANDIQEVEATILKDERDGKSDPTLPLDHQRATLIACFAVLILEISCAGEGVADSVSGCVS